MMSVLKFILSSQLKRSKLVQQTGGFTLIELLVAMIMAVLIITPLLGFMINILDTDRKEQAKVTSEQEIQTAIDYIARDLQQAVYIYDADGLTNESNPDPSVSGIKNQIPPLEPTGNCTDATQCQPVLVFWKRKLLKDAINLDESSNDDKTDDTFVYSLVAYYLIKDNNETWSKAARIARFEISDGVQDTNGVECTDYPDEKYAKKSDGTGTCPDQGFKRFDLTPENGNTLKEKMNKWTKANTAYNANNKGKDALVLVDFIDQTTTANSEAPQTSCPPDSTEPNNPITWSKVTPGDFTGFYVCIDSTHTTAQVFLRGNALARVQSDNLDYAPSKATYFPQKSVRVQGRGYLFSK